MGRRVSIMLRRGNHAAALWYAGFSSWRRMLRSIRNPIFTEANRVVITVAER